jgi:hypothetical protein
MSSAISRFLLAEDVGLNSDVRRGTAYTSQGLVHENPGVRESVSLARGA